ncbi:type II toxin-antitoxin system HicB family antitoxin [Candidatus Woesearchaeota archaeon]|nr:type II toxin-antitoxin system HicB family antitoxin [Candidatus Woesearchaeota archaeon]
MREKFNVIIEQGEDGYLISDVVELSGCHTQAKTLDELIKRTKEAISLYLSVKKPESGRTKFLGLQQVEIEA